MNDRFFFSKNFLKKLLKLFHQSKDLKNHKFFHQIFQKFILSSATNSQPNKYHNSSVDSIWKIQKPEDKGNILQSIISKRKKSCAFQITPSKYTTGIKISMYKLLTILSTKIRNDIFIKNDKLLKNSLNHYFALGENECTIWYQVVIYYSLPIFFLKKAV